MYVSTSDIVQKANYIVSQCGTRDPHRITKELGIEVLYYPFNRQRGAYKVIMRNRFMFIKNNLHPVMENIVLLHELGHDTLHRAEATEIGGFEEFNIFDMRDCRMEYEANVFASQIALPDDDFLELAERGYDTQQIARALNLWLSKQIRLFRKAIDSGNKNIVMTFSNIINKTACSIEQTVFLVRVE